MPAMAVHHTATEDSPWDGPAAVKAMPNSKATLHYCHAWEDTDAGDEKADYRFPHHKVKGGPANLAACRNGLARLEGSTIPDGDKAGVKEHLQAHLDDGNQDDGDGEAGASNSGRPWRSIHNRGTRPRDRAWYRIEAKDNGAAEVLLYDEIGGWWGLAAEDFVRDLAKVDAKQITLRINSPGGDVFDGLAIYNSLRQHSATVTARVEGLAASAASFIAMAADTVQVCRGAMLMIHDAAGFAIGNAADMRTLADLLDKCSDNIADLYAGRAGGTVDDWRAAMRAETWYSAREAVEAGLADELLGDDATGGDGNPTDAFDLSIFAHAGRDNAPAPWMPGRSDGPRRPTDRVKNSTAGAVVDTDGIAAALRGAFKR
ncbi:head maturation protease, ClpP-related [Mycobacterium sp.]|uniref:head maturation protease, ClpP-related n=1 Tax=Mycobacterium sp. TaxID=1785 RepID=UPI002B5DBB1B|nr:head maturation protease, ClpP-related [Mycobacterium sp.]HTY35432.1 head maturation protease, ClpP-related [Mycobacterium sp.]